MLLTDIYSFHCDKIIIELIGNNPLNHKNKSQVDDCMDVKAEFFCIHHITIDMLSWILILLHDAISIKY